MARHKQWHLSGWPAILLAPLVFPLILLIVFVERLFGSKTYVDLKAKDVEDYLQDFLEGTDRDWDWDDFTSIPITNPSLDDIHKEAASVGLPLTRDSEARLRRLLAQVRAM